MADVTVHWRPGCGFCMRLLGTLGDAGVDMELVDIWEDPEAAAFVRSVARGHETVPTVVIDGEAMVNPHPQVILAALRAGAA